MPYPVTYSIQRPERYNRVTVLFRWVLAIPLYLLFSSWSTVAEHTNGLIGGSGPLSGLLGLLILYAWVVIMLTGRFPASMRSTAIMLFRWLANIEAYLLLLADPFPPFGEGEYPLNLGIIPAEQYNRLTVFFRVILAIPHYIILFFLGIAAVVLTIVAWFAILFTAQYPQSMYDFNVGVARWGIRVGAYLDLLVDEYPPFSLSEETGEAGLQPQTA